MGPWPDRWPDATQLEAWVRNWLIGIGRTYDLPLSGRNWEFAALTLLAVIAAWLWLWPTRRAFRSKSPVRLLVFVLNLVAIWFWPLWIFAMLMSGIRRAVPPAPGRPAKPGTVDVAGTVIAAIRKLAAAKKAAMPPASGGPWARGKAAAKPATTTSLTKPAKPSPVATPRLARTASVRRASVLPNRASWVRRRG